MRNKKASDQVINKEAEAIQENHFIVGVGASAGGLEAINELFDNIPEGYGFSYVVIQHLSPNYKSLMDELLAKHTKLKIIKAEEGKVIEPNCIYLIPNKNNMVIRNGRLHLIDKPSSSIPNNAIDVFFESLAEDKGNRVIGIVLSGTGSDGTKGIAAIKERRGMVIVQDPVTAKFDGMPNNAIASGNYDFILPPELMSEEILRYPQLVRQQHSHDNLNELDGMDPFQKILRLIKDSTSYDFTCYKKKTLERRISKRMAETGINELREYTLYLLNNPEEVDTLANEFLIGVTRFFRDPFAFDIIRDEVIPDLINKKNHDDQLKVWVTACSTGEEAYTLAILIHEHLERLGKKLNVKIFATDMDSRAIEIAAKGVYPISIESDLSRDKLNAHFSKEGKSYIISREIRKMVIFAQHNIIKDPPFGQMDMVSCRNMLIYMRSELQKKVMETFHFSLSVGGYLFLGSSESAGAIKDSLKVINKKWNIFQTTNKSKSFIFESREISNEPRDVQKTPNVQPKKLSVESKMKEAFHEAIVEELGYAAVFINESYDLLQAFGDYKKFLHLHENQLRMSLLKMVPKEVSVALTLALRKALSKNEKVVSKRIRLGKGKERRTISLIVKPYLSPHLYEQKFLLVLFRDEKTEQIIQDETDSDSYDNQVNIDRLSELEEELKETKEDLQTTVEELETSNEELQSSNEELLSSNEELQSTNEELQSLNEELHTVNAEHQIKIKELVELNDDLNNYFSSSNIGQIFVDRELIIRKYTPEVTKQVNLIDSDVGRPINHLSYNLKYDHFVEDIRSVINTQEVIEKELEVSDNQHYLMRIIPYIRQDKSVDGAVITFVDITRVKQLNNLLSGILQSSPNGIMAFDSVYEDKNIIDFKWVMANDAIKHIIGKAPDQLIGKSLLKEMPGMQKAGIFKKMKKIASKGGVLRQEVHYQYEELDIWIEVLAAPMKKGVAMTISDIHEKKEAEEELFIAYEEVKKGEEKLRKLNTELEKRVEDRTRALTESEQRFRLVAQATNDAIWDWNMMTNTFWWNDTFEEIFGYDRDKLEPGIDALFSYLHNDELEAVKNDIDRVINHGDKQWSFEHRFKKSDGSYAYVYNRAYIIHNEYGVPYRILGSMIDVSKLKEVQEELKHSNKNLKRINVDLDNFVYTASHDLKAPITNLESLISILKNEINGDGKRSDMVLEKMDTSIQKFKDTLKALAEITKVQRNPDSTSEFLSIKKTLDNVQEDIKQAIEEEKPEIHEDLKVDQLYYSRINLRSIIYNLLSNAIKYKSPDRKPIINIRSYEEENYVVLEVEDNGLGMNERQQKKLFSMFKRFHKHVQGTGIGLYMVKRMVENRDGFIEVESEEGEGTSFRVFIKKEKAQ
ncbi:two-component system CheB/CheR fusion protein [Catalinimonas alkaloidigena]|uniref:chemotaxis protein CheB n=1 Tax=Catalinimonas alkaloidigena TaxID=1075417 RepID=UPI0024049427|nr:chemotaxis protein CheB [Catalinimonas alkaloidigena]MDF9799482.1 two-component system CheB/CheR fusion protein [Catalinimonas alkaloidigena]